jgi:hypothetical protein
MTNWIVAFYVYETLTAIQQWHLKNVVMAAQNSFAAGRNGDITGGAVGYAYIATAWLGRFNGIAFLLFIAWKMGVLYTLGLWVGALLLGLVANALIRAATGYAGIYVIANLAVVGVPLTGILAWWWAWKS